MFIVWYPQNRRDFDFIQAISINMGPKPEGIECSHRIAENVEATGRGHSRPAVPIRTIDPLYSFNPK